MMEHKAFLFDYESFDGELRALLENALLSGDSTGLVSFINANLGSLKDPYEGEPLADDWQDLIETQDAHQYGDFALTKYYDPKADTGLGADWDEVQQMIAADPLMTESPVLGSTVGPPDDPFDPGKMGAYFQTKQQVQRNYSNLTGLGVKQPASTLNRAIQMLQGAVDAGSGLYVTF
jgi:hypothetical protein